MLDERKAAILRAVVEEYIDTAQPVGSAHVVQSAAVAVSSATVRNDMATLEQEGYLRQPHTSAGRIPTEKGYRFFVDHLGQPASLRRQDAVQVRSFFEQAHGELEQMLQDTSRLLGDLTTYAGVVVGPAAGDTAIRSIQLVGHLAHDRAASWWCCPTGSVEKHTLELADPVGEERIGAATAHLAAHLTGAARHALADAPAHRRRRHRRAVRARPSPRSPASTARCPTRSSSAAPRRWRAPSTPSRPCARCSACSSSSTSWSRCCATCSTAACRSPSAPRPGMAPLAECALIVAPYQAEGEPAGTIGVLGPSRMDYPQAMAAVAVVSRRLSQRLSDG